MFRLWGVKTPQDKKQAVRTKGDTNCPDTFLSNMAKDSYFGFLCLPATEKMSNLTITANVKSASWTDNPSNKKDWPKEVNGNLTSTVKDVPMIHNPRLLKATVDSVGAVVLQPPAPSPSKP